MHGWQILAMDVIDGKSFSEVWRDRRFLGRANLLWATEAAILRLNRAGVRHDDVFADNVRVDSSGRVRLVDFGDASLRHPIAATVREHAALLFGRHGLFLRFAKRAVLLVMPGARDVYRRAKLRRLAPFSMKVADEVTAAPFTAELQLLQRAWGKAARWNSGRTEWLAYPSLTVAGVHFAGWRPWLLRWNRIVELVDFRNKNVIDLGCNIGLLPSFAMLHGARSAMGVDADATLVEAASEAAAGLGVPATFRQQDFDSPQPWEDDLAGADLVVAMSIVEWVSDRSRLLGFIGEHNEVLYEGHESLVVESERLRSVGFSQIEVVMVSDSGRPLLYGRKA
jgi:2-polyprenyl-3-methyl-5-hydroxy-6-metoxy-1,4-benzoquinol methylase